MSNYDNTDNYDEMDLTELKELIEHDFERFELPQSLKSESLMHLLDEVDAREHIVEDENITAAPTKKGKVIWLKWASAAACFALVFLGWNSFQSNTAKSDMAVAAPAAAAPTAAATAAAAYEPSETKLSAKAYDITVADEEMKAEAEEAEMEIEYPEQPAAKSYDEIFAAIEKMTVRSNPTAGGSRFYNAANGAVPEVATAPAAGPVMLTAPKMAAPTAAPEPMEDAVAESAVYETNTQVKGVDESDIVKTDGRYIYHYHFDLEDGGAEVSIFGASNLSQLSTIKLPNYSNAEMYVSGDRLIIVQQVDGKTANELSKKLQTPISDYLSDNSDTDVIIPDYYDSNKIYSENFIEAIVFDISDHKAPVELHRFRQEGTYVSSRLSGDTVYLISNKRANGGGGEMPIIRYIPSAGSDDDVVPLSAEQILLPPYIEKPNFAVVSSMNINSGKSETKAVLGMVDEIMMSKKSLFLTATVYGENRNYYSRSTGISRFDVTDGGLKYLASGKVAGYIDNQFSLDEHNGMLRIATTSYNDDRDTVNNLFVLDQKLEPIGEVTGLAESERIYSVRFMGDTAYVVTFKETDPLFVIDLSDPAKPVVKGELKIPGFSEYLHPVDENTLVGLGKNTYVNHNGGVIEDGLKLSLFDVSDPTDPRETASYLIGNSGSSSEALNNHKAFMYYPEKKLIGFPATIYTSYGATSARPWMGERKLSFSGYIVTEVAENGFNVFGTIPDSGKESVNGFMRNDLDQAIERGVYIGNTLYTFSQNKIMAFSIEDFTQIGEYKYN